MSASRCQPRETRSRTATWGGAAARHPAMHAAVLRYLNEVARRGSIRKAADALNVASSAINRQVLKLEADLGVRLFDRMPDGMHLTPAGEMLLRHVRDTLYDYDRLLAEIDELRGLRSGHVRIAALDSLLVDFLPRALGQFSTHYPSVTFSVRAVAPMTVFEAIVAAEADIGLTFVAPTSPAVLLATSIPMPVGALMAPNHRLATRHVLKFSDFANEPVLLQQEAMPVAPFVDAEFAAFRRAAHARFISNSIELLRQCVRAGLGAAFFTRLGFLRELASGELVWIPLASSRLEQLELGLFIPAQRTLPPATAAVVSELTMQLTELGSTG